jgi:RHS repeat-associated protein
VFELDTNTSVGERKSRSTGKERDIETGLDYFGARYYGSNMGRFTSPDPMVLMPQKLGDPQQWNMYSYVRNTPLSLMDPTGMYICGASKKECDAFDKALQEALKSKDKDVLRAAQSYGQMGQDNGVNVSFGDPGNGNSGSASPNLQVDPNDSNKFRAQVNVVIKSGLSGTNLVVAAGHEGVHVADAQDFAKTATMTGQYDLSKNLTNWQTELNAYKVSAAIQGASGRSAAFGACGSGQCTFGPGMPDAQVKSTTMILLANPSNGYNRFVTSGSTFVNHLGVRQFSAIAAQSPK